MKQKSSRGLTEKTENASERNAPAQKGKRILPEGANRKRFEGEKEERLTWGSHMSGLKSSPAPEDCGGRRRRTTARQGDRSVPRASACPSASVGGGLDRRRAPRRRRHFLRRTAARVMVENSGGCCKLRIEARVRRRDALESYWHEMGGRGARTGANRAGSRCGSRQPESGKKAPSGLFQSLGVV